MYFRRFLAVAVAAVLSANIALCDNIVYGAASGKPQVVTSAQKPAQKPAQKGNGTTAGPVKGTELKSIRLGGDAQKTRIVMDLTSAKKYVYKLENNNTRLVITIDGVSTAMKEAPASKRGAIKDMILATYGDTLQLIVDLKVPVAAKVYSLKGPDRIVIDLANEYEAESMNQVEEGLIQGKYVRFDAKGLITAYMLDVDPKKFDVRMALPWGDVSSGLGKLSNISRNYNAVAAVNGGYFDWSDRFLVGDVRINGVTAGMVAETRAGLIRNKDGSYDVGKASYSGTVTVNGQSISFWGVNAPRGKDAVVLYNRLYGSRTGTNEFGKEFVISRGMVQAINQGNSEIPPDGMVVSVHGQSLAYFAGVKVGDRAVIDESFGEGIDSAADYYGAGPQLVMDGRVNVTSQAEAIAGDIANGRAPRTAAGVKANGHVLLMVVDGRQSHSMGASLTEMAQLMVKYGAVKAVNFDGGGSTEMVLQNKIVNSPSDGGERSIGNALLVMRR